jgi:hypothetical protein
VEGFGVEGAELVVRGEGEEFVSGVGGGHGGGKAELRMQNAEFKKGSQAKRLEGER